jgi:hypothetical protein
MAGVFIFMTDHWPRDVEHLGIRYQRVWDAVVLALGTLSANGERRAYLDIGADGPDGTPMEIGLDVAALDEAVILRTIIMVRQYRRLRRGRMAFGELN